ncbi:MAG: hypothetical protein AAGM38_11135 [Pseudomonadota bacterium]
MRTVTIGRRFNGPPSSGNGGYCCGVTASFLDGPAMVRLKAPPPLETPLTVERDGASVRLMDQDKVIATGAPASAPVAAPPLSLSLAAAEAASGYEDPDAHYFPSCFVCGPAREEGDGLRIFAGAVDGADAVAAPWTPHRSLAVEDDRIGAAHVWAALDCPSYFALQKPGLPALLGQMTAAIHRRPDIGEPCIVIGWRLKSEGRKHLAATALTSADGETLAIAEALWIELSPEAMAAMKP